MNRWKMTLYTWWDVSYENPNRLKDVADELVYLRNKTNEIRHGNESICKCPNCSNGFVWEKYPIEMIGQCDYCFEEIKLKG